MRAGYIKSDSEVSNRIHLWFTIAIVLGDILRGWFFAGNNSGWWYRGGQVAEFGEAVRRSIWVPGRGGEGNTFSLAGENHGSSRLFP